MSEKTQLALLHIAGVAVSALVFWLTTTVLKPYPEISQLLIGAVLWLYGKFGFQPTTAVVESILKRLTPDQVGRVIARASSRPPPMPDAGAPEPASPFAKSPSARPPSDVSRR
jgi:hypothetical protein